MITSPLEKLCPAFKPEELLSPDGLELLAQGHLMLQAEALEFLQSFRLSIGVPILVNHGSLKLRGYRSPAENQSIGDSAKYSRHVQGIAFDCTCPDIPLRRFKDLAVAFGWPAVFIYPKRNFIHLDCRALPGDGKQVYGEYY
jgi:hypothetical protein